MVAFSNALLGHDVNWLKGHRLTGHFSQVNAGWVVMFVMDKMNQIIVIELYLLFHLLQLSQQLSMSFT